MADGDDTLPSVQDLYDEAACGLLLTGRDGTICRVNRTFCHWIGYAEGELVGKRRMQDLLTMGGRIFHQTHWTPLLQIQGSIAEMKLDMVHRDGHTIPMMINVVRRHNAAGIFDNIAAAVAEDRHKYERELLRARKHAEDLLVKEQEAQQALALAQARLRLALESAQLFVWDIDPATGERRYEEDVARLLGYSIQRTLSPMEYAAAIHPDDRAMEALAYAQALDAAGQAYRCVYRLMGIDGMQRTVSSSGRGFFDADGKLLQFVGVLHDVTEISRQRATAEDRALFAEQMVGIVSHDLRNPLSAIQMGAQLLIRREPLPNQLRAIGYITNSANRAQRLIEDLLDFTQARVGRGLSVSPSLIDLHKVVADSLEELALAFPERTLQHIRVGDGECAGDADRIVQLIGNLVANAVAYGASGRPIEITSRIGADAFVVTVHNEGTPVPANMLGVLFEPMIRATDGNNAGRSVGLGLFIVREIARAHGGGVSVDSSAGNGTRFTASFPRTSGSAQHDVR
jgi:sigma-B regulation protein RsbU (phosphoserine phosphatase)